jgi:UDP-N-acetylmuramoyl-L-alanyl-D-glutamate--2,6-diaminopimelate ligase
LLAGIFSAHGWRTDTIGTLTQVRTTPEAPDLQARLAHLREAGTEAVAMEVSSHALAQHRIDATRFAAGVLTNVTQDHLDFHRTMEDYFEAKARLFVPGRIALAVVNRDDPWGRRLLERLGGGPVPVETFGDADATDVVLRAEGSRWRWDGHDYRLALAGRFNVRNALAAATCARALGVSPDAIADGLASVHGIPGRFQRVDVGQPFTVVVDYAHTPDGLAAALGAAREVTTGRIVVVFGAGGDRDRDKRPAMGEAAARLADHVIVTSDNPRRENPTAIIEAVVAGVPDSLLGRVTVQEDRRAAIAAAVAIAAAGDLVLVAGKGHEQGQDLGDHVEPFDDVGEARAALERVLASRGRIAP